MAILVFLTGVLVGGVAVLLRPWLADVCSGYGQLRPAEELLGFGSWPGNEAASTLETLERVSTIAPLVAPRALSLKVHVKDTSTDAEQPSVKEETNSHDAAKHDKHETKAKTGVDHHESSAEHAEHEQGHGHGHESPAEHAEHEQAHGHHPHHIPGEHAEHEHAHGHHHMDLADIQLERGVSLLTLGAVAFFMGLFYLVNHRDEDMRRYAYQIIGETISIFCSVLMFNAMFKWVVELTNAWPEAYHVAIFVALYVVFFVGMEVIVMMFARVHGTKSLRRSKIHGKELGILHHVMNAKTFGAGAAQMCGAATIRSFGRLQLWAYMEADSLTLMLSTVPLAFLSFVIMMFLAHIARRMIIWWDGIVDEAEFTWVQIAEQCEHEVCGLCVGFLLASVARVAVTGSFPHVIVADMEHVGHHTDAKISDVLMLCWIGLGCVCVCFFFVIVFYGADEKHVDHEKLRSPTGSRVSLLLIKISGMTFAWCMCFANHLFGMEAEWLNGSQLRLFLSVLQSVFSLMIIRVLDFFSDLDCTGARFNSAFITIIEFLAVTLGLSWEHAFHECVHVTVEYLIEEPQFPTHDPKFVSFFLCALLCIIVLPAYRLYIVPTRYELIEEYEHRALHAERDFRRKTYDFPNHMADKLRGSEVTFNSEGPCDSSREAFADGLVESTYHFREVSACNG